MTTATAVAAAPAGRRAPKRVLPGFGLSLGYTLFYLSIIVLIPLSALIFKTFTLTWEQFWAAISAPRVMASYRLTFGASFLAALVNLVRQLLLGGTAVAGAAVPPGGLTGQCAQDAARGRGGRP